MKKKNNTCGLTRRKHNTGTIQQTDIFVKVNLLFDLCEPRSGTNANNLFSLQAGEGGGEKRREEGEGEEKERKKERNKKKNLLIREDFPTLG